jgi:outer membrane protein assembly factor BamB
MGHEDTYFTPEAIDEQIDRLRSDSYLATSPSPDVQMLQELRSVSQSDESRLAHIWERLAANVQQEEQAAKLPVDIKYYQQRKWQQQLSSSPTFADSDFPMHTADSARVVGQGRELQEDEAPAVSPAPRKKKKRTVVQRLLQYPETDRKKREIPVQPSTPLHRSYSTSSIPTKSSGNALGLVLAQLVAVLIVGGLILVPMWTGYQKAAVPATIQQPQQDVLTHSIYLSNDQGIVAVDTRTGQARWSYNISNYALGLPVNPIVGNGLVYAESQDSIYAIDAITGTTRWSHTFPLQISPYMTNKSRLVLSKNAVYVSIVSMEVYQLDALTGKVLRTYKPQLNTNIVSIAVEDNVLYAFGLFDMTALRLSDGKRLWYRPTSQSQVFGIPHVVNGILYTITSSDINWPYVSPKSISYIEAFEADSGYLLWQSNSIQGSTTDISIVNGTVYDGSTDGSISAYDAKTGTQLWSKTIAGVGFSGSIAPLIDAGILYIVAQDPATSYKSVGIIALDISTGHLNWQYPSQTTQMKQIGHKFNPPVVQNGVVFVNDSMSVQHTSDIYALFAGAVLWHRTIA